MIAIDELAPRLLDLAIILLFVCVVDTFPLGLKVITPSAILYREWHLLRPSRRAAEECSCVSADEFMVHLVVIWMDLIDVLRNYLTGLFFATTSFKINTILIPL